METHPTSLWEATAGDRPRRPALAGDIAVDVAIVGGGYTGLWTAYALKTTDPALRVALIEAEQVGFGASGRNGGWVSGKLSGLDMLLADPRGRTSAIRLQREMIDTVSRIGDVIYEEGIDCGWAHGGTIVAATRPPHVDRLKETIELRHAVGFGEDDYRWLDAAEAQERLHTSRSYGASYTPHCAAVDPLRLARGLADAIDRLGVDVYESTPARRIDPGKVMTDHGDVRAEVVVRATEAYTARFPELRRDIVPVYSLMISTPPLDPATWSQLGLQRRETFSDGRKQVIYGQRTDDGRLAFGGRGAPYHFGSRIRPSYDSEPAVFEGLREALVDLFPVLEGVEIDHRWGGPLAVTRDWLPTVTFDRDTKIGWAGGYAGQGVATANLAGRIMSDLILGRDTDITSLPIVGHRSRRWEPEPLRWLGINLGLAMSKHVDRSEDRTGQAPRRRSAVMKRLIGL